MARPQSRFADALSPILRAFLWQNQPVDRSRNLSPRTASAVPPVSRSESFVISLKYEYHDANLVSASFGPRREASFVFDLYPIFYRDKPTVALRFGGIFNDQSVAAFVAAINADPKDDDDAYHARCNIVQLDAKKPSKGGDVYVFLDLDHCGQIRIHCQHVSETAV